MISKFYPSDHLVSLKYKSIIIKENGIWKDYLHTTQFVKIIII
jgi:hypothetical protein